MSFYQEDIELAERIAKGDSEAENQLFSRFSERIQFLVRAHLRNKVPKFDRDDILSEVHQAVLLSIRRGGYNSLKEKPLEAYIAGIASNTVGQYFRRQQREILTYSIDKVINSPGQDNIYSSLLDEEKKQKLKACLKKIKPKYTETLLLRFYEDKSIDEISAELKIPKRKVSERINYALKLILKECRKEKYFQY